MAAKPIAPICKTLEMPSLGDKQTASYRGWYAENYHHQHVFRLAREASLTVIPTPSVLYVKLCEETHDDHDQHQGQTY